MRGVMNWKLKGKEKVRVDKNFIKTYNNIKDNHSPSSRCNSSHLIV